MSKVLLEVFAWRLIHSIWILREGPSTNSENFGIGDISGRKNRDWHTFEISEDVESFVVTPCIFVKGKKRQQRKQTPHLMITMGDPPFPLSPEKQAKLHCK